MLNGVDSTIKTTIGNWGGEGNGANAGNTPPGTTVKSRAFAKGISKGVFWCVGILVTRCPISGISEVANQNCTVMRHERISVLSRVDRLHRCS